MEYVDLYSYLEAVKCKVRDSIKKYGLLDRIGEENVFYQVDTALKRASDFVKAL